MCQPMSIGPMNEVSRLTAWASAKVFFKFERSNERILGLADFSRGKFQKQNMRKSDKT
jgi:hypothetical protein